MPRYIDADKLIDFVSGRSTYLSNDWDTLGVLCAIDEQPTADVVERKDLDTIAEAHEQIGYEKGYRDGYAQSVEDDLISRQAAIDAVGSMLRRKFGIGGDLAEITLSGLPTADAKIVRCKDCKYGHELIDEKGRRYRLCNYHFGHGLMVEDHGFCKWGERRDDE